MDRSRIQKGNLRAVIEVQEEIISFFSLGHKQVH